VKAIDFSFFKDLRYFCCDVRLVFFVRYVCVFVCGSVCVFIVLVVFVDVFSRFLSSFDVYVEIGRVSRRGASAMHGVRRVGLCWFCFCAVVRAFVLWLCAHFGTRVLLEVKSYHNLSYSLAPSLLSYS